MSRSRRSAQELVENPQNWRLHPLIQRDALEKSLAEVGVVDTVLVNGRSGRLIDGHLRRSVAGASGEALEVLEVDFTDEQERLAILVTDGLLAAATDEGLDLPSEEEIAQATEATAPEAEAGPEPGTSRMAFRVGAFGFSVEPTEYAAWFERTRAEMVEPSASPRECLEFTLRRLGLEIVRA